MASGHCVRQIAGVPGTAASAHSAAGWVRKVLVNAALNANEPASTKPAPLLRSTDVSWTAPSPPATRVARLLAVLVVTSPAQPM